MLPLEVAQCAHQKSAELQATRSPSRPLTSALIHSADIFPQPYHIFFGFVEPALTIGGAVYASFAPLPYHQELVPTIVAARPLLVHPASLMAVRQLGSCFLLFALFATLFFNRVYKVLKPHPTLLEPVIYSYLLCLGIADWTFTLATIYSLGIEASFKPFTHWNTLVFGNIGITLVLFAVRAMWFAGIGRATTVVKGKTA
ncbi:hypothetical protein BCR35DRAFT_308325 [Leucosporidium creatinivorum]|uniref:DUF7704 domain-containing protein n=1 Tax=Leucosporidium creatinivorum TaxID=106004 RepID=A0A1Y2E8U5_9BASI|nr:hypothetical protein BCR35DRAFT_308325 [Leucosporidium creatinivorum]